MTIRDSRKVRTPRWRLPLTDLVEAQKVIRAAVRDKTYQDCPLGPFVDQYLQWKANEQGKLPTTLRDYEIPLAYLCLDYPTKTLEDFEPRAGRDLVRATMDQHWGLHAPPVHRLGVPAGQRSPRTKRKNLSILSDFFKWCVREEHMRGNPCDMIDRPKARGSQRRIYEKGEPERLVAAAPTTRDQCALAILCEFGIRKAELQGLRLQDYDPTRRTLTVYGKGGKYRNLPVRNDDLARMLAEHWVERAALGHPPESFLVYPVKRGVAKNADGDLVPRDFLHQPRHSLCDSAMHNWFKRMLRLAGIPESRKMHELRHTAATELLRSSRDITVVQQMLGHADIGTTAIYTHLTQDDLAEALDLLALKRAGERE